MKKLLLIQVFVCFSCVIFAQNTAEKTGSLLWRISGNGLKKPSYIFGTHHAFPISFLDSVSGVKQAFASCEQMVGELVLDDMVAVSAELQKAGMMHKDSTWKMLLSDEDYRFVDEQLTSFFGAGLQAFGVFKPSMVSLTYVAMFYQKMFPHMSSGETIDIWFQQEAAKRKIPIVGLETVEDQINAIIDVEPLKQQAADLVCLLRNLNYVELSAKQLNQFYRVADFKELFKNLRDENNPCPTTVKEETALNEARNERWLKKLPAIFAEKSTFVAVGCLHLVGEAGLLAGLEKAGFTVEAIR